MNMYARTHTHYTFPDRGMLQVQVVDSRSTDNILRNIFSFEDDSIRSKCFVRCLIYKTKMGTPTTYYATGIGAIYYTNNIIIAKIAKASFI